jgi:hypothetical protein
MLLDVEAHAGTAETFEELGDLVGAPDGGRCDYCDGGERNAVILKRADSAHDPAVCRTPGPITALEVGPLRSVDAHSYREAVAQEQLAPGRIDQPGARLERMTDTTA